MEQQAGGGKGCLGCLGALAFCMVAVFVGPVMMAFFPFASSAAPQPVPILAPGSSGSNFVWPVAFGGIVTDRYGWRYAPEDGHKEFHSGLDIAAPLGTVVRAVASGRVIYADWLGNYGYLVQIDHGEGWQSWYGHLYQIKVDAGQEVEAGEMIGLLGSTGRSTGPHLHLEFRVDGSLLDPEFYLSHP